MVSKPSNSESSQSEVQSQGFDSEGRRTVTWQKVYWYIEACDIWPREIPPVKYQWQVISEWSPPASSVKRASGLNRFE